MASYKNVGKTQLIVTVHSGELNISATFKDSFESTMNFKAKEAQKIMTIDVNEPKNIKKR